MEDERGKIGIQIEVVRVQLTEPKEPESCNEDYLFLVVTQEPTFTSMVSYDPTGR